MAMGWKKGYTRYKDYFLNIAAIYKQKKDLKMFLEILLSLGTITFFVIFALKPTVLTITQLIKEIQSKEEIVAKLDTKIQNVATARTLVDSESNRIPLIESSIPGIPSPETFVRQLEGLAAKNGVNLLGMSIGEVVLTGDVEKPKKDEPGLTPLPEGAKGATFSLSVSGPYVNLSNFLADLETLRRPLAVDNSGISSTETPSGKTLVILVTGRMPYYSDK